MTAVTDEPRRVLPSATVPTLPILVAAATLATLAMSWPVLRAVLGGTFTDPDDAMRLVEVRAWMAGQTWFDVSALRLDPPTGAAMHWSRLIDVPNALLIRLFGLVTSDAEAWDRIVLPTLLLAALYAGVARLATVLLGRASRGAALLGTILSGATLVQFQPGRIGHHAPDTVALVWAVAAALASLDRGRARHAALAGALVALSLAMSLETLPFVGALATAMVVLWIVRGTRGAPALLAFALGLGGSLPLLFLATVDPRAWFAPSCDALGAAHLGAASIFAVGCVILAAGTRRLTTSLSRLAAAALVGLAALAFVGIAYPACLHGPFTGVDPLVRDIWLDHVVESLPLLVFLRDRPALGLAIALPTLLGTLGCLWAACRLRGVGRLRFAVLAGLGTVGLAMGFWQVRVFGSVLPLVLCGGLYAVAVLRERLNAMEVRSASALAVAAILPFTATGWAIALPVADGESTGAVSCLTAAAVAPLDRLPPGRVVAPIDAGSHLLEATRNTVFAAPYHRDNDGNRFALDVFLAPLDKAQALLAGRDVLYVMTCQGLGETARLAARAPNSLAAQLQAGAIPAFLHPVPLAGTPYRVFAVAPTDR